jgi:hypothetical protein
MAVGGEVLKIGPFKTSNSGNRLAVAESRPHLDNLYMEGTSSMAHVEPKQKSQDPAVKAKRLKRLLANPDFAEAVEFERSGCKKSSRLVSECTELLKQSESTNAAIGKQIEGLNEVQRDYIEQLKENKSLNKVIEAMGRSIKAQSESTIALENTIKAQDEMLELNKKARNPSRVTGGKRGRPQGSKSKAVAFGAEAMPDNDLVTFGTTVEFEAALMYGWTGQETGSGFCDLAPSILHYNWF